MLWVNDRLALLELHVVLSMVLEPQIGIPAL